MHYYLNGKTCVGRLIWIYHSKKKKLKMVAVGTKKTIYYSFYHILHDLLVSFA